MTQPDSQKRLKRTDINAVPQNILYRLSEPLVVDRETVIRPGEYMIVNDNRAMPLRVRTLLEHLRKSPEIAYCVIRIRRDIFVLVPVAQDIHEAPGIASVSGDCRITLGAKSNIAPSLVTAERIPSRSQRIRELPRNRPLFLARNYQHCGANDVIHLIPLPPDYEPSLNNILLASLFILRGTSITLSEKGGKLFATVSGKQNHDEFPLAIDDELEVFMPEEDALG